MRNPNNKAPNTEIWGFQGKSKTYKLQESNISLGSLTEAAVLIFKLKSQQITSFGAQHPINCLTALTTT